MASAEVVRKRILAREEAGTKAWDQLPSDKLEEFARDGFVAIKGTDLWSPEEFGAIMDQVNEMDSWPDKKGAYWKYYENNLKQAEYGGPDRILCRVEKFLEYAPALDGVLRGPKLLGMIGQLFGEPAILYKEKINYKLPGGDGFKPHQDVAAGWWLYNQSLHISALVCIDPADEANGALELVRGRHREGMMGAQWKEIPDDKVAEMNWEMFPSEPGDVVFFDSYVPHRSGPNPSKERRRIIYSTYGKASEGDWRAQYYTDKGKNLPPDIERDPNQTYAYKI